MNWIDQNKVPVEKVKDVDYDPQANRSLGLSFLILSP